MATTITRLMGTHEIRIRLGDVSRQRVYQITSRTDFPRAIADLAQGKVWLAEDVEGWMKVHRHDDAVVTDETTAGPTRQWPVAAEPPRSR